MDSLAIVTRQPRCLESWDLPAAGGVLPSAGARCGEIPLTVMADENLHLVLQKQLLFLDVHFLQLLLVVQESFPLKLAQPCFANRMRLHQESELFVLFAKHFLELPGIGLHGGTSMLAGNEAYGVGLIIIGFLRPV